MANEEAQMVIKTHHCLAMDDRMVTKNFLIAKQIYWKLLAYQ